MCRRVDRCEYSLVSFSVFFFFQAEDGIRDLTVTGVQTCALPISYAVFCLKKKKNSEVFCSDNACPLIFEREKPKRRPSRLATHSSLPTTTLSGRHFRRATITVPY